MSIRLDPSALRQTHWHGHLLRFVLGGLVTVGTGLVAEAGGPVVGGLFLAFPSIFPLGMAMLEKLHDEQVGPGARGDRARRAGIAEATGAGAGSVGLLAFALAAWLGAVTGHTLVALVAAMLAWVIVAFGSWTIRRGIPTSETVLKGATSAPRPAAPARSGRRA
jgi:hypothetical protein